ncbi:MAG: BatA domain-containing protein [Myxococcales bacterium]
MERLAFAHPAYLWGLAATALPILVHLFNRRRPRPLAFGAIDFVLRSQRQKARRLRLRQLLLLALRCLLVAGIAVALARPSLRPKGGVAAAPAGPQATALVLDASLSMRYRVGTSTLFARAKREALLALDRLGPDEPATVGLCAGPGGFAGGSLMPPSFDRVAQRRLLQVAQATYLGSDLTSCLAQAARALGESPVAGKRIIAFGDLAAHSIRLDGPAPLVPAAAAAGGQGAQPGVRPSVVLVDAAEGKDLPNAAVVGIAVQPSPALGPRGYEVVATVANHSASTATGLPLALRIGQQTLAKGFVDVPAQGTAKKSLSAVLPPGPVQGRVELSRDGAQGLDEDDAQDFSFLVPRDVKALIVDGAPSSLRTRDEAYFVEAALSPLRTGSRIAAQTLDADAAAGRSLDDVDVVLLLDVPAPGKAFAEKLRAFVDRGGGLFIALGDHVDPDAYNDALGRLLPRPLHLLKTAAEPGAQNAEQQAARFGAVDWKHPLFRVFTAADREGLQATRAYRYALLRPDPGSGSSAIASFDDGAPALVASRLGAGRVLLCTTGASMAWTDWPIRASFLPVLQQAVAWLAGALEEKGSAPSQVGDERALVPPAGSTVAAVLGPSGKELPLRRDPATARGAPEAAGGPPGAVRVAVDAPGIYRVRIAGPGPQAPREDPALAFAARLDPKESDLRRVDQAELKAHLGGAGSAQVAASAREAQGPRGTPLWSGLLLLGVLALVGEGVLTRR